MQLVLENEESPSYLWRVYANDTKGFNSASNFASAAAINGTGHPRMTAIPYQECRTMLTKHLSWADIEDSEFISWTSSLLYAIQYAVRKTKNLQNARAVSKEWDIKICLLNNRVANVSTYAASDLIEVYDLPSEGECHPEYHTNEYITHGHIFFDECASVVSLERLRAAGLFELVPELDEEGKKHQLYLRVHELRRMLFLNSSSLSRLDCQVALRTASLYTFIDQISLLGY